VLYLLDGSWGRLRAPQPPERLTHLAKVGQEYHLWVYRVEGTSGITWLWTRAGG
jgi:acid phosphatase type 7